LDLKHPDAQRIAHELMNNADVVIENFRPGVMESWGLGPDVLKQTNPQLVYARISGYGQTGPYASKPGFASVCEGMSGFRYVNGFPDQAPVRPNLSIGDTISGIHAALGIVMALLARERSDEPQGQVVDVALVESMFNLMEAVVPEFSGAGVIRQPSGTTVTGIVPTNTYRCRNKKFVVIGGNGDSIFQRLMTAAGRDDLAHDPRLANNAGRVEHEQEIDDALAMWCMSLPSDDVLAILEKARVPSGPIYNVQDMFADPHFQARELFERVEINGKPLDIPAILPKLTETPGRTDWPGGDIGAHTKDILRDLLHLDDASIDELKRNGVC
jgi:crotonobetainyl-CoA:carnitine CoA-transferase CaiB-like acyl-CoA transferase